MSIDPKTQNDLWLLPLSGDRKAIPWLRTPFRESHGQVSPNGKWLAYNNSDETGPSEVYVQPFPGGAGKWQISTNGGSFPRWRGDGGLFLHEPGDQRELMAVEVRSGRLRVRARDAERALRLRLALNLPHEGGGPYPHTDAVSADGQRFLIPRSPLIDAEVPDRDRSRSCLNWEVGLKN